MKKTTIELPDDLMKRVKLRALRDGKKLKQTVSDLLSAALASESSGTPSRAQLVPKHLPLIKARSVKAPDGKKMTGQEFADFVKDLENESELERYEKAFGHQHVDRVDD